MEWVLFVLQLIKWFSRFLLQSQITRWLLCWYGESCQGFAIKELDYNRVRPIHTPFTENHNLKRSKNHYQCVIPKTMDDDEMTHFTMLDRPNCWSKCKRAGRCNYCGSNGYCCHADGRGSCTWDMAHVLKESFIFMHIV